MEFEKLTLHRDADVPLHLQLADELRRYLLNSTVKCEYLPSERSLCERLKLNRSTVHRAYETLLQGGVVRQCPNKKLEVIPGAKKILAGAFPSIGVLLPEKFSSYVGQNNTSTLRYLKGVFDRAAELECSIYILQIPPPDTSEKEMRSFIESNFQKLIGIIHLGGRNRFPDPPLDMVFQCSHLPQICISGKPAAPCAGAVYTDFTAAVKQLARTLLEKNCRTIGLVRNIFSEHGSFAYIAQERDAAVSRIFVDEGVEIAPEWVLDYNCTAAPAEFFRQLETHCSQHRKLPDAIWCHNDNIAFLALEFFRSRGIKVPEELKIAGFDGIDPSLELTSIGQQYHQLGAGAVDLLWEHFEHGINEQNRIKTIEALFISGKTI